MNTAKNDALNIAVELEMNMNEEKIQESFEMIKIHHFTDEEKNNEEEENDDIIQEQNNENVFMYNVIMKISKKIMKI